MLICAQAVISHYWLDLLIYVQQIETFKLELTIARELLPFDLHLDYINYLLQKKGPTDVNIVQILHLSNSFESKHWFTRKGNQLNSDRHSVGTSYFTKHKSYKYKQSICFKNFLTRVLPDQNRQWGNKRSWWVSILQPPIWTA